MLWIWAVRENLLSNVLVIYCTYNALKAQYAQALCMNPLKMCVELQSDLPQTNNCKHVWCRHLGCLGGHLHHVLHSMPPSLLVSIGPRQEPC